MLAISRIARLNVEPILELTDIGSNLTHESFHADRGEVLARALAAGVVRQVITGADVDSSRAAALLARAHGGMLWSTAGVHPHNAGAFDGSSCGELRELLRGAEVVAVGECGLDYHRNLAPPAAQRAAFAAQLELAAATATPVFLHQRDAHADFTALLTEFRPRLVGAVAHCFTAGRAELDAYLRLDLYIGVTGWVSDERRGAALRDAVPHIPADRLLIETDAPYLLPRDLHPRPKSRRNEPANLPHVAQTVAGLRRETVHEVAATTTRNATRLFGLRAPGCPPTNS